MLVTTSLILKYNAFPCPPLGPHHRSPLTSPPYPPLFDPLALPHLISHQLPSKPLSHSRHDHSTPLSHYHVSLRHPPTPPCPIPTHPILSQLLHRSSKPFAHNTHDIIFHTDFLVQSSLSISTSFLHPSTHSPISIIFLPPHVLPSPYLLIASNFPANRLRFFPNPS